MKTVLEALIEEAQGSGAVAPLLRKLKVLATRTGARDTLLPLVNRELDGYTSRVDLPAYRGPFETAPVGSFVSIGSKSEGIRVPKFGLPEDFVTGTELFEVYLMESVATLESRAAESAGMSYTWPAEAVTVLNIQIKAKKTLIRSEYSCLGVSAVIPRALYIAALDRIRNIALDLALDLEAIAPQAGEPGADESVNAEALQHINHWYVNVVATGSNVSFETDGAVTQRVNESLGGEQTSALP
ncbi:AbiTii domain-containing protein [Nocardia salmonicida]|uniref:AbiTii domain-containing protein n=1 Tax=Nocardia salmonicida TaxID=53431 RepID=UPI003798A65F